MNLKGAQKRECKWKKEVDFGEGQFVHDHTLRLWHQAVDIYDKLIIEVNLVACQINCSVHCQ